MNTERPIECPTGQTEEEVTEVALLLSAREVAELERLASAHDLTVGRLLRTLLRAGLDRLRPPGPPAAPPGAPFRQ